MAVRFSAESQAYSTTASVPNGAFTVTWWAYLSVDRGIYSTMWEPGATTGDALYTQVGMDSSRTLITALSEGDDPDTGFTLAVGQWYCFALTQTAAGGDLELHWGTTPGALSSASGTANTTAAGTLRIGRSVWSNEWWDGRIAAWKQWSAVLSDAEIATELGQYAHVRTANFVRSFWFKTPQTTPTAGTGDLTGGTGTTTETGPSIPDTSAVTGSAAATLGGLTATVAGVRDRPGALAATLGGLAAAASGEVSSVTAAAALGGLTATAAGRRSTTGSAAAPLGGLTAAVTGRRTTAGSAIALLGGLTATATGTFISYLGAAGVALNPVVWRVDRDTLDIVGPPLQHWDTVELSPIVNTPGSARLVLPAGTPQFTDVYDNVSATPQRDQEIEVWLAGNAEHRSRWLLQQKDGDDLHPGQLWVFDGVGLEALLAEVLVGPQDTDTLELLFSGVTYGTVLITAVQQAQERDGVLDGVTWDFTTTHDSNGDLWANTIADLKFAPDDTLLAVAQAGPTEVFGEFAMGPDRVLHAYNYGARGLDRTGGTNPLRLQAGANLTAAARRESSRVGDAATAALAKGAEGQYQWATDSTAQAQRGRRVEVAVDAGQVTSEGGVLASAQGQLDVLKVGVAERTHGVVFGPGLPLPGLDYDVADWGLSVTGNQASAQRITQWTLSFRRGERASGTVRTNTRIQTRLDRLRRELERVRRGAAVVGTSTPSPDLDDGKSPAQVAGLAASSSAYTDADGATSAAVVAAWSDVTTNADATAADDVVGYLTQFRYTAGAPLPTGWQPLPQVADNTIDFDRVVAGTALDLRVAAIDKYDHIGAWSSVYSLTTGADATPPPVPSTPVVESYLGILTVAWDGLGSAAEAMPPDFDRVDIYASTSSGFTPGTSTYVDSLRGKGVMPSTLGDYGDTYYVKLIAVDRSGNASAASAQDSAVLVQAGDGDVSAVSIGKLTAGIMSALMTVSGIIRTAASGSRVELDTNGFRCYLGSAVVLNFDIPSSALALVGKLTSGAGVGVGRSIVVDPNGDGSNPAISLYPNATAQRIRWRALNDSNPGNGASAPMFHVHTLNASGVQEGGAIETWDQGMWLGTKKSGSWRGGAVKLYHPDIAGTASASLAYQDSATGVDAFVTVTETGAVIVDSDGASIRLDAHGGEINIEAGGGAASLRLFSDGEAQLISNSAVKSFVIDHPADPDRWLVHACTESPTAGVEYSGTAVVEDHLAVVELPPYFEALCEVEGRTVHLTPELAVHEGMAMVPSAAPSRIVDGRFHLVCPAPDGTRVHWLVKATRRGAPFEVEPLRTDVDVRGDGPYRYIANGDQ